MKKITTDKPLGNYKVKEISIENIKNIESIETSLSDWVIVGGKNAHGKTSFVDSIFLALQGSLLYGKGTEPKRVVQHGKDKATIKLVLKGEEKEITVERIFKNATDRYPLGQNKFTAYFEDDTPLKQSELNELINVLTVDPLKLDKMNKTDSIKEVQKITGLDTSEIDVEIEKETEDRKIEKQNLAQMKALVNESTGAGVPEEVIEVNINDLLEIQKQFDTLSDDKIILKNKSENYQAKKAELEELEKEVEKMKIEGKEFGKKIKLEEGGLIERHGTREDNQKSLENAQETNEKAQEYKDYLNRKNDRKKAEKSVEDCEVRVADLREKKLEMIKGSNMPDYMKVSEELGIMVDCIEYKQLNTARKIEVAIDLVLISGSPLRILNIEEGGELDMNTLSEIQDKILEAGFQIFIQRASIDEFSSIVIHEGAIVKDPSELIKQGNLEKQVLASKIKGK